MDKVQELINLLKIRSAEEKSRKFWIWVLAVIGAAAATAGIAYAVYRYFTPKYLEEFEDDDFEDDFDDYFEDEESFVKSYYEDKAAEEKKEAPAAEVKTASEAE